MTTVSSSPSISPKPFAVPSSRSIWGAASSSSPGGGTSSPFQKPHNNNNNNNNSAARPSPPLHARNRDVPSSARSHTSSSASVTSATAQQPPSPSVAAALKDNKLATTQAKLPLGTGDSTATRDFGTQYTPPGLPPTADARNPGFAATELSLSLSTLRASDKRKDTPQTETSSSGDVLMSEPTSKENSGGEPVIRGLTSAPEKDTVQPLPVFTTSSPRNSSEIVAQGSSRASKRPESNASDSTSGSSSLSLVNSLPSSTKKSRINSPNMKIMPRNYMECDIRELGIIIADMLMELIRLNDKLPPRDGFLTRFHSRAPPAISVRDYLQRLIVHATLSPPLLLATVYYIDRLCALYPAFTITSLTVHRFLITATTVAAKGLSDSFWTNHTYARVGGVSTKELAMLELDFLSRLDWAIVPRPEVLVDYYKSLVARTEGYILEEGSSSDES